MTAREQDVSVVICAYNEVRHIGRLLRSLKTQTVVPSQVILVDDGSTDGTAAVGHREQVNVIRLPHRGPAAGRNAGAGTAHGDILVFLDGDMECSPSFLDRITRPIKEKRAVGTFTREIYVANLDSRWARAYAVMRQLRHGRLLPPDFPDEWDNFRAIERDAFTRVGGYDNIGYGEDRTLSRKLGLSALVAPGAVCFHYNPDTLREIFSNGRWIGRGPQIRELDSPWSDHLPHRILRSMARDVPELSIFEACLARCAYHFGVLLGLAESTVRPGRHWK